MDRCALQVRCGQVCTAGEMWMGVQIKREDFGLSSNVNYCELGTKGQV